ncbi:hypothetical protein F2Y86_25185 [Bacteroides cellulosilyticus]|uniref:Uncharacterized protein n=1 Tax=Bacteroides cellulosilyticus TaxID=246787 RepID=A0A5M6A1T0_9BACE|nr:hypothetical protein F2Y86_25185 [Bacteroides cellulosilyticus]RYU11745.1 hypothetical protein EAJ01_25225 [Bacteroides cellulosilyticus]
MAEFIHFGIVMNFHHRVTQSFTELYSFDFKLIKLRETLCYSVVNYIHNPSKRNKFRQRVT